MNRTTLLSTIATDICTGCGITAATMDSVLDDIANNCVMPEDLAGSGSLASSITSLYTTQNTLDDGSGNANFSGLVQASALHTTNGVRVEGNYTWSSGAGLEFLYEPIDTSGIFFAYDRDASTALPIHLGVGSFVQFGHPYSAFTIDIDNAVATAYVPLVLCDYTTVGAPSAGMLAYDYTNNVPVFSDGTYWYPLSYGAHY